MSNFGILGAIALSLSLAVATPASAVGLRGFSVSIRCTSAAGPAVLSQVPVPRFERHRPLPAALGVLRLNIREVYGRRWSVASLPVKAKKSGSGRSFLLDKLVLRLRAWIAPSGQARTFDFMAAGVGYVPFAMRHYIDTGCGALLKLDPQSLAAFRKETFSVAPALSAKMLTRFRDQFWRGTKRKEQ